MEVLGGGGCLTLCSMYLPVDARGHDGQGHSQGPWEPRGELGKSHLGGSGGQRKASRKRSGTGSEELVCEL